MLGSFCVKVVQVQMLEVVSPTCSNVRQDSSSACQGDLPCQQKSCRGFAAADRGVGRLHIAIKSHALCAQWACSLKQVHAAALQS